MRSLRRVFGQGSERASPDLLWAIDFEMTGLDPARHQIVEVGMVPIRNRRIQPGQGWSSVVRPDRYQSDGTVAHQLMPVDVEHGIDQSALPGLIWQRVGAATLLFHHAPIDLSFLRLLHERYGIPWPEPITIDTVDLLKRRNRRLRQLNEPELPLQLDAARKQLKLPAHGSHRATADAIATAELWLALTAGDHQPDDR